MRKRQLTPNQIKVLEEILSAEGIVEYDCTHRRTIEVLARKGLIAYEYVEPRVSTSSGGARYYDVIHCRRKASKRKAEAAIQQALDSRRKTNEKR